MLLTCNLQYTNASNQDINITDLTCSLGRITSQTLSFLSRSSTNSSTCERVNSI